MNTRTRACAHAPAVALHITPNEALFINQLRPPRQSALSTPRQCAGIGDCKGYQEHGYTRVRGCARNDGRRRRGGRRRYGVAGVRVCAFPSAGQSVQGTRFNLSTSRLARSRQMRIARTNLGLSLLGLVSLVLRPKNMNDRAVDGHHASQNGIGMREVMMGARVKVSKYSLRRMNVLADWMKRAIG